MKSNKVCVHVIAVCALLILLSTTITAQKKAARKQLSSSFATAPFDLSVSKLPPRYTGHNIEALFSWLRRVAPEKGEFESTNSVIQRLKAVDTERLYAFADPESRLDYNADEQAWKSSNILAGAIIVSRDTYLGSYRGSNAFGVSKTVRKIRRVEYFIDNHAKLVSKDSVLFKFALPMPEWRAKELKGRLSVLYVCRLFSQENRPGFIHEEEFYYEPKLDDPEEVDGKQRQINVKMVAMWVYDRQTGEVLQKHSPFDVGNAIPERQQATSQVSATTRKSIEQSPVDVKPVAVTAPTAALH